MVWDIVYVIGSLLIVFNNKMNSKVCQLKKNRIVGKVFVTRRKYHFFQHASFKSCLQQHFIRVAYYH